MEKQLKIPNNLNKLRTMRGLSGTKIAELLDVSPQYYYDLEKGERRLNEEILIKVSKLYNCSTDYILSLTNNYQKNNYSDIPEDILHMTNRISELSPKSKKLLNEFIELLIIRDTVDKNTIQK